VVGYSSTGFLYSKLNTGEIKLNEVDKRDKLDEGPFSYRVSKDNKVFIKWHDKEVKIIKGKESEKFILKIGNVDMKEAQLIMAKITGNFKRGNEKSNK
jgi:predicted acetyltransferase